MSVTHNRTLPSRLVPIRPVGLVLAALVLAVATYGVRSWTTRGPANHIDVTVTDRTAGRDDASIAGGSLSAEAGPAADVAAIDVQIRIWGEKAAADPRDDISAGNLGVLYLGRGRLTGDAADYERALAAADRAVAAYPTSNGPRALKATVLQATHDFHGALTLATSILKAESANVDAMAVAGDARLELGRLDEARAIYAQIAAIAPGPALDVRLARLAWLSGDAAGALNLARQARDGANRNGSGDPSFYEAQLGEFARITGNAVEGRRAFDAALAIRPTDQLALLGRARLDAFEGHDPAAIAGLRAAAAITPRPETMGLLSDLLARDGDTVGAARAADTVRFIDKLDGAAARLFDRQIIGFELDHGGITPALLDRAVAAAQARPDAGGLDTAAWAAYRLGDLTTAASFSVRARAGGSVDARVLYHAGAIAIARGDVDDGRGLIRRALDLGPALDPLDRQEAEALLARS
jgi:tetratricopeptide (TPR) repeat protein